MAKRVQVVPLTEKCVGETLAKDVISKDQGQFLAARNSTVSVFMLRRFMEMGITEIAIWIKVELYDEVSFSRYDQLQRKHDMTSKKLVNTFDKILKTNNVALGEIEEICKNIKVENSDKRNVFQYLSELKSVDDCTYVHSVNVSILSGLLAGWLKMSERDKQTAAMAGLLHDVGKTLISERILKKKGALSRFEFAEMKTHTIRGYELLKKSEVPEDVKLAALMHHERNGGNGYPNGVDLDKINYFARIVAVVDIFDAMTHTREYRKNVNSPFSVMKSYKEEVFGLLDLEIVDVFLTNIAYMYHGEQCRLSDGRLGEIVFVNPAQIQSPIVRVGNEAIDLMIRRDLFVQEVYLK